MKYQGKLERRTKKKKRMQQADDKTIFVWIRQDLTEAQQKVALGHVVARMATFNRFVGDPRFVMVGVPDLKALNRVAVKIGGDGHTPLPFEQFIPHTYWQDPDPELAPLGILAICTNPIDNEKKELLKNYRLWNPANANNAVDKFVQACGRLLATLSRLDMPSKEEIEAVTIALKNVGYSGGVVSTDTASACEPSTPEPESPVLTTDCVD